MPAAEDVIKAETDFELLQRTALGDSKAFAMFVARHQAAVFRHASCLAARREDAEDLLQETFFSAFKGAGNFRGEASGRTWLFHITRNAACRRNSKPQVSIESATSLDVLAIQAGWGGQDPETLAMLAEDKQRFEHALSSLPMEEREIILLRDWQKLSGEEAGALLGISLAATKSRLHRARLHLAALLREPNRKEAR